MFEHADPQAARGTASPVQEQATPRKPFVRPTLSRLGQLTTLTLISGSL